MGILEIARITVNILLAIMCALIIMLYSDQKFAKAYQSGYEAGLDLKLITERFDCDEIKRSVDNQLNSCNNTNHKLNNQTGD